MKKLLTFIISLLLIGIASAQFIPCPIGGKLLGQGMGDLTIVLVNQRTNEEVITTTTGAGEWLIDWANTVQKYYIGDKIKITVLECESYDECKKEITVTGDPIFIEMDLSKLSQFCPITTVTTVPCEECPTTIPCPDCPDCPSCPECNSCCEECPVCPDSTIEFIVAGLIVFIAGMGVYRYGFGYKVYTKESGEVVEQHKHVGITNYHSPNTVHSNPLIRHPKGMKAPKYKRNTDGKWEYIGE